MSLAVSGTTSSSNVIRLVIVSQELREILGSEVFVVFVGAAITIWIAIAEIAKLFKDKKPRKSL